MGIKWVLPQITQELLENYKNELRNGDRYFTPCTLNELVNRLISIRNKMHASEYRVDFYTKKVIKQYLELVSTKSGGLFTTWHMNRMPPNKTNKWDLPKSMLRKITFYEISKESEYIVIDHFEHNILEVSCEFIDYLLELYIIYYSEPVIDDIDDIDSVGE